MEFKWSCETEDCDTNIHAFIKNATNENAIEHLRKWLETIARHNDEHKDEVVWARVCRDQIDPKLRGWYPGVPGLIGLLAYALAENGNKKIEAIQQAGYVVGNLRNDSAILRVVKATDVDQLLLEAIKDVLDTAYRDCESCLFAAWKLLKAQYIGDIEDWATDVDAIYKDR